MPKFKKRNTKKTGFTTGSSGIPTISLAIASHSFDKQDIKQSDMGEEEQTSQPEAKLLAAILAQTLIDIATPYRDPSSYKQVSQARKTFARRYEIDRASALAWSLDRQEGDHAIPWTLEWICNHLGIDWKEYRKIALFVDRNVTKAKPNYRAECARTELKRILKI